MDNEQIMVPEETADLVNDAKSKKKHVCAVGTTVIRTLESATTVTGLLKPYDGWTNKFIFPPYEFKIPSAMITNFQLPKSIPLMSACAFGGFKKTLKAYDEAIKEGYKFGTYGDAMLIL
jgi:S-adenosylmethionine:tRNA ribosyltransferase-isomerase